LHSMGFQIVATSGTANVLKMAGLEATSIYKVNEGRPHIVDRIKSGGVDLVINTPLGRESFFDEKAIRSAAMQYRIPCITTLSGALAAVNGIRDLQRESLTVCSLQDHHSRTGQALEQL
jgi:carbamoyl-phosphate synthase large subunit